MLLQFSVENFLSFREPQVLSMLAAEGVDHPPHMVMEGPEGKKVLRCAGIYGANASGKSNLIKALEFGTNLVLKGTRPSEPLALKSFKLDPNCSKKAATFQWELSIGGVAFSYGFEATVSSIVSEWLFSKDREKETAVFTRIGSHFDLAESLTGGSDRATFLNFIAQGTRPNQLFLAEARERNVSELSGVWSELETFQFVKPDRPIAPIVDFFAAHQDFSLFASEILSAAGTGVERINRLELSRHQSHFLNDKLENLLGSAQDEELAAKLKLINQFWPNNADGTMHISESGWAGVFTSHRATDGTLQSFHLDEESDGTRRLVHLAPLLYLLEKTPSGILLAIDELERSLHPLLTRAFLERFFASSAKSQLLFTTHDTNLLDLTLLSRDAIWFTEKDPAGATVLYSLAEYKQDQIAELGPQLEKGYLQGRFGAIPFLGDASRLGWKKAAE